MKRTINILTLLTVAAMACALQSCERYLDAKPNAKLTTPSSLQDLQYMLDDYSNINNVGYPATSEVLSDNYYLSDQDWTSLSNLYDRNNYLWIADDTDASAYTRPYMVVYIANVVLEQLPNIPYQSAETSQFNQIKGSALFLRAALHYAVAQLYGQPYDANNEQVGAGIALRYTADYKDPVVRSSVKETYASMISDLKEAARLLPVVPLVKSRPSKPAAFGWLARAYLAMNDFENAGAYADSCLQLYDSLMDFNALDASANAPISRFNEEVIFHARGTVNAALHPSRAKIDTNLYQSYADDDLRKIVYFKENADGSHAFKGDYDGSGVSTGYVFGGIATDEIYLVRAEAQARSGNTEAAMEDLNVLLASRFDHGAFVPLTATDAEEALALILGERRKELLFRGTRWTDLRRLRNDPRFFTAPKRTMDGNGYELPAESPRFTLLIPHDVITINNMPQNP
ncbi:RagB/SusD family nutrient uptake outer membrane protein [Parapedobacter tibetensis]|uniref:RagB/SusD family nutrient uptake outer membrane protein n=1 Tax=Parapedobacter tibetensis TaxID=2972951 RepID=UPI00214D7C72|nr:RagB/SusD family nutrient uptake outer membrane protein [Parapedobacter tibetensis]